MTGGIGAVINTPYDGYLGSRLPQEVQKKRLEQVIREVLTQREREVLLACYYGGKTQAALAQELGVGRSTVCRTLKRAQAKLRRYLRY